MRMVKERLESPPERQVPLAGGVVNGVEHKRINPHNTRGFFRLTQRPQQHELANTLPLGASVHGEAP